MFKKSFSISAVLALLFFSAGCKTLPPLPAVNLFEPGWKIQRGQAVWRAKKDAPEIAGELLIATNSDGHTFVQFTKTPFPFAVAQRAYDHWQIEFGAANKKFSGRGKPPQRIIWLQLPRFTEKSGSPHVVSCKTRQWAWQTFENSRWLLRNRITGESLEGFLAP